ncbi:hypothetical protein MKX01_002723 [Papaver californicum]|nr:hypothetical protein MKX01_002723 [Papaver californicum]
MIRNWDDECEDEISSITKYYLVDDEEPVCYSVLPIQWCEDHKPVAVDREIILHGYTSSGSQKVYKQVIAWKFDLASFDRVKVEVLSKENKWIVLDKPQTSYEQTIRTIRLTLCCLHYLKRNSNASESSLLSNIFPSFNRGAQFLENDLRDHLPFIKSAVEHDETLASSKFLLAFLESPRKAFTEDIGAGLATKKIKHNVNDDWEESIEEKTNTELDDSVCAICDNGGHVLCCDGECRRCFHATLAHAGVDAKCESLGLSEADIAAPNFICLNCQYKQHQCFACGKLGSSDCSSAQEVFRCSSCGHFYHPKCVADLLYPENKVESKELQKIIAAGGSFTCPTHKCSKCKQEENSLVHDLQFAVCRRCPKAYHRKCLPREIAFGYAEKLGLVQRAWDYLLPRNRILVYCPKHEIGKNQSTPTRNHIVFPNAAVKANVQSPQSSQQRVLGRKRMISEAFQKSISVNQRKPDEMMAKRFSVQRLDSSKRLSSGSTSQMIRRYSTKSTVGHSYKHQKVPSSSISPEPSIDAETEKRMKTLMEQAARSISSSDINRDYKFRAKQGMSKVVNTTNSLEKAEGSDRAVRAALKKLKEDSIFEDSKDVIKPEILNQITQWKVVDKLRSYVLEGNMIVNASYTANDFTCLMKQRLEEAGINCSYEDYGVCQSKNGPTTDKCDWLSVHQLPTATKLIIVLNIPFGINPALAAKYMDKALGFRPKLLILFVPQDTKRLDKPEYKLVWEDNEKLLSKLHSFVSVSNDEMKIWNSKPPLLQFWSRCDWFAKHKKIVERMPMNQNDSNVESELELEDNQEQEHHKGTVVISDPANEDHDDSTNKLSSMPSSIHAAPGENKSKIDDGNIKTRMPDTTSYSGFVDFAPGPYNPFSHDKHSCCGWIDDDDE